MIPGDKDNTPVGLEVPTYRYGLGVCKGMLDAGAPFWDAYAHLLDPADREALKAYFVHNPKLPVHRTPPPGNLPMEAITSTLDSLQAFTGNACQKCYGVHMVRNGTCELCLDCGETSGCS